MAKDELQIKRILVFTGPEQMADQLKIVGNYIPPPHPSPNPTLTLNAYLEQNGGLGEEQVDSSQNLKPIFHLFWTCAKIFFF